MQEITDVEAKEVNTIDIVEPTIPNRPLTFSEKWHHEKLLKQSKKKAKKALVKQGYNPSSASAMVKRALKNMNASSTPERRGANRGG